MINFRSIKLSPEMEIHNETFLKSGLLMSKTHFISLNLTSPIIPELNIFRAMINS